jgi:hypothetical protein
MFLKMHQISSVNQKVSVPDSRVVLAVKMSNFGDANFDAVKTGYRAPKNSATKM